MRGSPRKRSLPRCHLAAIMRQCERDGNRLKEMVRVSIRFRALSSGRERIVTTDSVSGTGQRLAPSSARRIDYNRRAAGRKPAGYDSPPRRNRP